MPNYCSYEMKVSGKSEKDILEFAKICSSDYSYSTMELPERHFCRVFEANYDLNTLEENEGVYELVISGYCAWSVSCCFLKGENTYYTDLKREYRDKCKATYLQKECKRLNLFVEIFSEETGCMFSEHILCTPRGILKSECVDIEYNYDEDGCPIDSNGGFDWVYKSFCLNDFEKFKVLPKAKSNSRKRHKRKLKRKGR